MAEAPAPNPTPDAAPPQAPGTNRQINENTKRARAALTQRDLGRILVFLGRLHRTGRKRDERGFWAATLAENPDVFPGEFAAMPNATTAISRLFSESVVRGKNRRQHADAALAGAE